MCAAWSAFFAALHGFDIRCFQRIFGSPSKPVSKESSEPVSKATAKLVLKPTTESVSKATGRPVSEETQFTLQVLDMTREPHHPDVSSSTKRTSLKRSRKHNNKTRTTSKSIKPLSPKSKTAPASQEKKRKIQHTQNSTAKKPYEDGGGNSTTIIKLKTGEAREPSSLQTPLSTCSWDPYPDRMPDDVAKAVSERLEIWLSRTDEAAEYASRAAQYGEDIANRFPSGETPGFARIWRGNEGNEQQGT